MKLDDYLLLLSGQDFPPQKYNSEHKGIPYIIGASNIENEKLFVNRWTEEPSVISILNDVLVVCKGAGVGKIAMNNVGDVHIARQIQAIRDETDIINSKFIKLCIASNISGIIANANGLIPGLKRELLLSLIIPVAPIEEQSRIVTAVEQWFTLIDSLEKETDDLSAKIRQIKSTILDLAIHGKLVPQDPNDEPAIELLKRINPSFVPCDNAHYENIPKGWTEINVGELAQYTNGKAFQPSDWEQRGLPIIRIQNLNDENCKYNYTSIGHEEKYRITNGDLLFAWAASLGVYIWKGDDAWLNQHIFKVEPLPFIDKQFLYYLFQYLISEFYNRSHGSGMVHITKKEFETTIALLPPLSEQSRIVKSIESYYATLDNISANL